MKPWRIWIDTGGTFTDAVGVAPDGSVRRVKILSSSALRGSVVRAAAGDVLEVAADWPWAACLPGLRLRRLGEAGAAGPLVREWDPGRRRLTLDRPVGGDHAAGHAFELQSDEEAPLFAARLLTGTPAGAALPVARVRLATTLGTNALLQRGGVPTALFVTRGFGDLTAIGTQQRPDLFALTIERAAPLHAAVVEVPERLDAAGNVLEPLDAEAIRGEALALLERGVLAAAVALMHAYRDPVHELELARRLRAWGFAHVSCSSELAPRIKLLTRASTAVVDAYLAPVVDDYLERVRAGLGTDRLLVMTSAGGLLDAASFRPKDSLLSGPAGGVVGAAAAGLGSGERRVIGFDMGGTSTDVSRHDGDYEYVYEHRVGDAQLAAPALAIETVAAGGGSICRFDGGRLRVGPDSAGASPGPACYGAGGPLTLTDVNLLAGRLHPEGFEIPVRERPARERLAELREELLRCGETAGDEALLEGLLLIADETMADAIRRISLRRGYDPAEYALVAFGGAGAQHACGVARRLGIPRVVVPADASLLSAIGLGHARVERFVERQVLQPLAQCGARLAEWTAELAADARQAVESAGVDAGEVGVRRTTLHLRFAGQDSTLEVDWRPGLDVAAAFARQYEERYGHRAAARVVELESLRVVASSSADAVLRHEMRGPRRRRAARRRRALFDEGWLEVPELWREDLQPGDTVDGPALIREQHSTTVVAPAWRAEVDEAGALILDHRDGPRATKDGERPEVVRIELFTQRFRGLVHEMGERLERTAVSTNVKERLDFSCALLDAEGELIVNAPHIPVHLGALGLCVRSVCRALALEPGDVAVTNHPAYGGSHLPDVTVITPVFSRRDVERPIAYVASRAHHAEIGGVRPGSMPPAATCLAQEGVVLAPAYLVRRGRSCEAAIRRLLLDAPHPTRAVEDNLADLRAAVAANQAGVRRLHAEIDAHGEAIVVHYMRALKQRAALRMRETLGTLADGVYSARELLDDGTPLCARIEVEGERATVDFDGTGGVHPGNLNATPAIVRSVVLYVLRLLVREPLPLNEGLLLPVTLRVPAGLLDPPFAGDPRHSPAVVGGNVETSQRLVDTLLKALRLAACSQGTMNNVIFGNERYGYYETLGGGAGAVSDRDGADAVHTHMTNTRITDPEVLEQRFPVRVERFAIRRGSGGAGRRRGGDGIVRELVFLEPAELSVLTQHRRVAPYGMEGGEDGRPGVQYVLRRDGTRHDLAPIDGCTVAEGDRLHIETPGGGAWGHSTFCFNS